MHRLFSITEMVTAILTVDSSRNDLLQSCLQVNRLFSHEAVRILWRRCGAGFPVTHSGRDPTALDLAKIAAYDMLRAQYYADCIYELRFAPNEEVRSWQEEVRFYKFLTNLRFPALKSFAIETCDVSYLEPRNELNHFLLQWLELSWDVEDSPNLKAFHMVLKETFPSDGIENSVWFVKFAPILSSLSVELLNDHWSLALLKALAALPALRKLQGGKLSSELLSDLSKGFPVLEDLATTYSGSFESLTSLFPQVSVLTLELSDPIHTGLEKLGGLSVLTSIDLTYAMRGIISGPELLALAHGCPHIRTVNLPSAGMLMADEPCPQGQCIDDTTIDEFARALPKIETFSFGLENRSALTHQSVISLARHCPELGFFHITANICIPDLIQGLEEVSEKISAAPLPSVTFMGFYLIDDNPHLYGDIASLARRLCRLAPILCELSITDGSENDDEFRVEVEAIAGPWNQRDDTQD
ncbi:hypothetical protein BT63DRAFT_326944 [Microthyrium microscopicum]|uniref:F-box domain-containing protein n=1 Tax=Microthyrium microscopicum TaxID=703497 RepID=A0A6A6U523_9PEZI|nr:hypothetical protein BT63DRAFT_326944 [Microthyrium microscopicum]